MRSTPRLLESAGASLIGFSLLLMFACDSSQLLFTDWPPIPEDAETVIVVAEDEAWAGTWAPGLVYESPLSSESQLITVLAYPETLDEMELDAGALEAAGPQTCLSRALVPADRIFTRRAGDDDWSESAEAAPDIAARRVEARCPCKSFSTRWMTEISQRLDSAAVAVVGDTLYVVAPRSEGDSTWVLPLVEGSTGTTIEPGVSAQEGLFSSWVAPDGVLWLGGYSLERWLPGTSSVAERIYSPGRRIRGIVGAGPGAPMEIYLNEEPPELERFDGETWSSVYVHPQDEFGAVQNGAIVWTAPGRVTAALYDRRQILFYEHENPPIVVPRDEDLGVAALALTETVGLLAGTTKGQIARLVGTELEPFPRVSNSALTGEVRSILETPQGLVYVTRNGWIGQVDPDAGVCIPKLLDDYSRIFDAAVHGEDIVVVGATKQGNVRAQILTLE